MSDYMYFCLNADGFQIDKGFMSWLEVQIYLDVNVLRYWYLFIF